ncbi:hypothetical protein DZK25_09965, partial [Wenzhouxiangella sp. 15181]
TSASLAQVTTEFTYQGELEQSGTPADGDYDFRFTLWDAESSGTKLQGPVEDTRVPVNDGLFTANIDFGSIVFGGQDVWLQIEVAEAGTGSYTTLGPRQQIKPAPMAQHALTVGADAVGSTQIVDGSITAADIDSGLFWSTGGNAAGSGDFLGTTNTTPLELRVNNRPVTRIFDAEEGNGIHAPNLIGGSELNVLSGGSVEGATIAGGGGDPGFTTCGPDRSSPCINTVADDFTTVVGGFGNYATGLAATAMGGGTTASGANSTAMGEETTASGNDSTAMGGGTTASGSHSTAIGFRTTASAFAATAMGDETNAPGLVATAMGEGTTASGTHSTAIGRRTTASGDQSTAMGMDSSAGGDFSFAAGRRAVARDAGDAGETDTDGNCTANVDECGDEGTFVWADSEDVDFESTGPDQFLVRAASGAGIGTSAPSAQLHAENNSGSGLTTPTLRADNLSTGAGIAGYFITHGSDATMVLANREGSGPLLKGFGNNNGGREFEIRNDGSMDFYNGFDRTINIDAPGGEITADNGFTTGGADFAEMLPRHRPEESIRPADLVAVRGGEITRTTDDAERLMIISSSPAMLGNHDASKPQSDHSPVAFLGQVPVRVRGPVAIGDLLVASGHNDGTARAVSPAQWNPDEHGPFAGHAWSARSDEGLGTVTARVGAAQSTALVERIRSQKARIDSLEDRLARLEQALEGRADAL